MSQSSQPDKGPNNPSTFSQDFQLANIGARVPERVARGVFSTGVLVMTGNNEFVLDFVLRMNKPFQVVARVILPMNLVPQFIDALKANLDNYRKMFGSAPPAMPTPPPPQNQPTIEEIYQDLKVADDTLAGAYANQVMVVHSAAEFCLEFIANFYPKAVITSRVFLSAPQVPLLLQTMTQSWQNLQAKMHQHQQPPRPPAN